MRGISLISLGKGEKLHILVVSEKFYRSFLGSVYFLFLFFFLFFYDRIQKIGCYEQTEFYSNFVLCWKRKDDIIACGSLWQKKLYTFWQFRRNSIDLFLGPSFFIFDRIQKIGCYNQTEFYSNFVSCGKHKDDINVCGSLWQKNFAHFWQFMRNSIDLFLCSSVFFFFFFLIELKRQVAMTRLSLIVISCCVGSTKTTLICVGHCGRKTLHILAILDKFYRDKIGLCLFQKNNPAFCPLSQTNS